MTKTKSPKKAKPKQRKPNQRLIRLRFEAGWSQRRLAYFAGLKHGVVNLAERGWVPQPNNAFAISEALSERLDREILYTDIWPVAGKAND